jgi:hypothetical protein
MEINKSTAVLLLIICITLLAIPLVWLTLQASATVPLLASTIALGSLVIANIIVRKTKYKPYQQPYQYRKFYTIRRIEQIIAVGVATTAVIGSITMPLIRPLVPHHFWLLYLVALFIIGTIIGDALQRILEKKNDIGQTPKDLIKLPINLTVFYSHNSFACFNSPHSPR